MLSRLMTIREQLLLLGVAASILLGAGVLIWRGSNNTMSTPDTFAPRQTEKATPDKAPGTAPPATHPATPTPTAAPSPAATVAAAPSPPAVPTRIGVGILGAVTKEGLYYFETGARVRDLLQAAGGALEDADLSDVNRTAQLIDQTTLLVPRLVSQGNQFYSEPPVTYNPKPYTRSTWYQLNKQTHEPEPAGTAGSGASASPEKAAPGGLVNINTAPQAELESLPGIGPATAQKIIAHRQSEPFQTIEDLEKVSGIGPAKMSAVRGMITVK